MKTQRSFLKDSMYLLIGTGVINLFGFLFHFFMGRRLGPESYGVLATLITLIGLLGIFSTTFQFSISKFVTSLKTKDSIKQLKYLYSASTKKINRAFLWLFLASLVLNLFLTRFLDINYWLLALTSLAVLTVPSLSITRGFLQGLQRFRFYGENLSIEGFVKLSLGILFVLLGFEVGGAVFAVVLSYFAALLYGYYRIKDYTSGEKEWFSAKEIYKYTLPMFFAVLFFTAFYSIDLILVKHFFDAVDAGNYAVISLLGKIVFFASFSVVQVMFPKVVELSESRGAHFSVLGKSWLTIMLVTVPILVVYYFFEELVVSLLFGSVYLPIAGLIFPYGMFMASVSFSKLLSLYFLSLKKFKFLYFFLLFFILEIVGIYLFHDTLSQVISVLMAVGAIFLLILVIILIRTVFKNE